MMTKRLKTILITFILLAVSISLLLTFFIFNNQEKKMPLPFVLNTKNITLQVGQVVEDFYSISDKEAQIEFEVENPGKIKIDKNQIVGLNAGSTKVTIIARNETNQEKSDFTVNVLNKNYVVKLTATFGCQIKDDTILVTDKISQFGINLFNLNGEKINNFKSHFIYDKQKILLLAEFGQVQINLFTNTYLQISFPDYNFIKTFNVIFI